MITWPLAQVEEAAAAPAGCPTWIRCERVNVQMVNAKDGFVIAARLDVR